jgi:L-amino acid N-acyltransferase YncA
MAGTKEFSVVVRPTEEKDLPQILEILDHYVQKTVTTFWTETPPLSSIKTEFHTLAKRNYPYLVAVVPASATASGTPETSEKVVGYINAHTYSPRSGYDHTAEMTLLVDPNQRYGGVGTKLMNALLYHLAHPGEVDFGVTENGVQKTQCEVRQLLSVMSIDVDGREKGLGLKAFYQRFGMHEAGYLKDVGWKMGKW